MSMPKWGSAEAERRQKQAAKEHLAKQESETVRRLPTI